MKNVFKLLLLLLTLYSLNLITNTNSVQASSLKIAPLLYNETLKKGEFKKGVIDISNPDDIAKIVSVEVERFEQVNNQGQLLFKPETDYLTGVKLDYKQFKLDPRESLRFIFGLDSNKLPEGGVYGVIFFNITALDTNPDNTSVKTKTRLGTLLVVDNGGNGLKQASVTKVQAPLFQFGQSIKGSTTIANTGGEKGLAFFPEIESRVRPTGTTKKLQGPLIFPGIERPVEIENKGNFLGFVQLSVKAGDSTKKKWVLAMTGNGRWVGSIVLLLIIISSLYIWQRKNLLKKFKAKK